MSHDVDDLAMLERLRAGDEAAFAALVDRYGGAMLRVARAYVGDDDTAQEVVQDTWLAVLTGLDGFGGRSALRSWIFAILVNRAKTRGVREARVRPFASLARDEAERDDPSVPPERFRPAGMAWPGHWLQGPVSWGDEPEARLLRKETLQRLGALLDDLPPVQRSVVVLRDVAGQSAEAVGEALGLSPGNVRVLLHRGRAKLRLGLERDLAVAG